MSWLISNVFWIVVLLGVGFLVLFVFNQKAAGSALTVVSASTGAFGRWLRKKFPIWIMQHEIDKASKDVNDMWSVMEEKKAMMNGLERTINDKQREVSRLDKMASAALKNNDETSARNYLLNKKRIQAELTTAEETLETNQQQYTVYENNLQMYQDKVVQLKNEAKEKSVSLNAAKADAALSKKLNKLNDLDDTGLMAAKVAMDEALDAAHAASQVANSRNRSQINAAKFEKTIMEDEVEKELKDLKAKLSS